MTDLDNPYPADSQSGNGLDYESVFGNPTEETAEVRIAGGTVPFFSYYIVHFDGASPAFSKKKGTPSARAAVTIKGGPAGTEGKKVFDDRYLTVSRTEEVDGVTQRKSEEDFQADCKRLQKTLNLIAKVGKFTRPWPADFSKEAMVHYAKLWSANGGFDAIVEISERKEVYQGSEQKRNRINWDSLRAFTDPALDAKLAAAGKTALDEAKAAITAALAVKARTSGVGAPSFN